MAAVIYLDTSAVLRAVLERGVSPEMEQRLGIARYLVTSRLSLVESARALHRLRAGGTPERTLVDIARELDSIWSRCVTWELTREVCRLAEQVAPQHALRTLDALHLATFLTARRELGDVDMLTADTRLERALTIV